MKSRVSINRLSNNPALRCEKYDIVNTSDIGNQKVEAFSAKQAYGQNRTQCQNYTSYLNFYFLDVDECKDIAFICGLDGICINKNGSYDCVCPEGQKPNQEDKRCEGR